MLASTMSRSRVATLAILVALLATLITASPANAKTTPVMGRSALTAAQLVNWFDAAKPARVCNQLDSSKKCTSTVPHQVRAAGGDLTRIANAYLSEGGREGVAADLAFIQAILETAWFYYPDYGCVKPSDNNFAGMGAVDGCKTMSPSPVLVFPTPEMGIRAQNQHLRAYSDTSVNREGTSPPLGSPIAMDNDGKYPGRYRIAYDLYNANRTWDSFGGGVWASDPDYACKILNLYRQALDHHGKNSSGLPTTPNCTMTWHLRFKNAGGSADSHARLGRSGDRFLACDWNGNGFDTPGVFNDGQWIISNQRNGGSPTSFSYGRKGDIPLCGDWNGNGVDTVGIVRDGEWHLRNSNSGGPGQIVFTYGRVTRGDVPIVGDWNGNRVDTAGIIRDGEWHLRNSNSGGPGQIVFTYGRILRGDRPLVGDWNGNGKDTIGIVRDGEWHLRNKLAGGAADHMFVYGRVASGDVPLTGDWTKDGIDTPAIVR